MHNIPFPSPQRPRILVQVSKIFASIFSYNNGRPSFLLLKARFLPLDFLLSFEYPSAGRERGEDGWGGLLFH